MSIHTYTLMITQPTPLRYSVLVKAEAPYPVLHVNEYWTALRGQTQADVEGQPLDLLKVSTIGGGIGGSSVV